MPASDRDRVEGWLAEGRLLRPIEPDGRRSADHG